MQVAILAGGLGTRLSPVAPNRPKSMVEILGRPFIAYQIDYLRQGGITDIVLCVGHLGEQIEAYLGDGRKFGVRVAYSYDGGRLLGTAGALKKAEKLLEDPFFTLYGDSYLFLDFAQVLAYFRSQGKLALMTVYHNRDQYEKSNTVVEGDLVKHYAKKETMPGMVYIEYGANIFSKEVLSLIPAGQPYSLEELFPMLIERSELLAYKVRDRFYQIGSPEGLAEFKKYLAQREACHDSLPGTSQDYVGGRRDRS